MASEEQIVPRLDPHGEAHEQAGVEEEDCGHALGDLLGRLVGVEDAGEDEAPVGEGSPEVGGFGADG